MLVYANFLFRIDYINFNDRFLEFCGNIQSYSRDLINAPGSH